jgi:hypothetical protein
MWKCSFPISFHLTHFEVHFKGNVGNSGIHSFAGQVCLTYRRSKVPVYTITDKTQLPPEANVVATQRAPPLRAMQHECSSGMGEGRGVLSLNLGCID